MVIKNGEIFLPDGSFVLGNIAFEHGKITQIGNFATTGECIDAAGAMVLPGYVDIHFHGAMGADICDGDIQSLKQALYFEARQGVTSVLGTTMAIPRENLVQVVDRLVPLCGAPINGATLQGLSLEGPFLSREKCGAQDITNLMPPDKALFDTLIGKGGGHIKLITLAPELEQGLEFTRLASKHCKVSIGHTNADYDTAALAFSSGADHVTHLFNAMPPFLHRAPGVVGAAYDSGAYVEVICDNHHLHPSVVRSIFGQFDAHKICLISDSMCGCGLGDGEFSLGGQQVYICTGAATLADGTLAGSVTTLAAGVKNAVLNGVSLSQALMAATTNPASSIGMVNTIGALQIGASADIQIVRDDLTPTDVWVHGDKIL